MTDPAAPDPLRSLTVREKETLRLLAKGHDAKSVARELGLSVHTVNERLRDARQKLRVSSSREAARLFAAHEASPEFVVDDGFGVATTTDPLLPPRERGGSIRLAWFGGGMLIMSLIIAALIFSSVPGSEDTQARRAPATPVKVGPSAASAAAEAWLALLDQARWQESWKAAARMFTSQVPAPQWAAMAGAVRRPLGRVSDRRFVDATETNSLPNIPPGEYQVVQFATRFAEREAIETVVLAREGGVWRVAGYFVK
ncbi:helix-turn-helix domain-containing protein [Sphingomonas rubra]|uniref:DNA-binding transcriptional regulator, CsgD family n=1 Tax=Sphingomonas rubra TaxID=634430 RepID=A0A1I5RY45_9SPHN|nr:DUF4019 domain-containing protein [Sphingomonas rubra]SFP63455.1 DNA-binding transcriptional regulator, CsgD family [Sphingomonas rubra]